jgi:hypothetical protein
VYGDSVALLGRQLAGSLCLAMGIFLGAIVIVSLLGAFQSVCPVIAGKPLSMVLTIQIFMLLAGALIIILTKTDPSSIAKAESFAPARQRSSRLPARARARADQAAGGRGLTPAALPSQQFLWTRRIPCRRMQAGRYMRFIDYPLNDRPV